MEAQVVEKSHTAGMWPNPYESLRDVGSKVADWFAPKSDASAMETHYEINVELPGVKAEDVSLHENTVMVRGEKRYEHEESGRTYFFSEREYGSFHRSFRAPPDADGETIDAEFKDGVLCIKIAKRAAAQPVGRKIEIRHT